MKEQMGKKKKALGLVPKVAKLLGDGSVDSVCLWWFNQPKLPEELKRLKEVERYRKA